MSHFNEVANSWDSPDKIKRSGLLADRIKKEVSLEKDLDILDFGCGTGIFGFEFIAHGKTLLGIDNSTGMLDVFNLKTKDMPNISSVNINLEKESLDKKFDLIISSMAFHHLNEPCDMLVKFSNMLNKNGKILIVDLESEDGSFHPDNDGMGVKHFGFSNEELASWADKANLNLVVKSIETIDKNERSYNLFLANFS